jgi:hypothetical protein
MKTSIWKLIRMLEMLLNEKRSVVLPNIFVRMGLSRDDKLFGRSLGSIDLINVTPFLLMVRWMF